MAHVLVPTKQCFKAFARDWLHFDAKTGGLLLAVFSVIRFALVLHANVTRSYQFIALFFVALIALPFLLLSQAGRQRIGLVWPARWWG